MHAGTLSGTSHTRGLDARGCSRRSRGTGPLATIKADFRPSRLAKLLASPIREQPRDGPVDCRRAYSSRARFPERGESRRVGLLRFSARSARSTSNSSHAAM